MRRAAAKERTLVGPDGFNFSATVYSHGWCRLAPFAWHDADAVLSGVLAVKGGGTHVLWSQPRGNGTPVRIEVVGGRGSRVRLQAGDWRSIEAATRRMLQLDVDLTPFHTACRRAGGTFARAVRAGFGRLLHASTLFEDIVKVLATTNTTWAGTQSMVRNLVALAGSGGSFPTPAQVAAIGPRRLASKGRWGYRASYLAGFSKAVARGDLDMGRWEQWQGTTEELACEVMAVPGLGPYATAHVLIFLGRYDRIGVDTVFRAFVKAKYFPRARKPVSDERMLDVYRGWGEWRALAYWADLWHESG